MKKTRIVAACAAAVTLATSMLYAPTASAAVVTQCAGTRVWSGPLYPRHSGEPAGRLEFWKGSEGRKCAMLYDVMSGKSHLTVWIEKYDCSGRLLTDEVDGGLFEYYAGGVQLQGPDAGRQYRISGYMTTEHNDWLRDRWFNTGC